jgi:hypothetical protein
MRTLIMVIVFGIGSMVANGQVVVKVRPAMPRVVAVRPLCPGPNHIWVAGYWKYNRRVNNYVWMDGHWARPRKRGAVWVDGHWRQSRGGWVYVQGHWS